ncbi:hypothetical protein Poli38472_003798 [Pythium oligandrum]|uniref:PSP proline-rich domain-containing protein n=1 Tax=Pythium oligandrum TaxID=41045 RepID=A0A8K1CNA1_PYTOL|nr:hypothetical protein Poli38472_003798 [Pythium oligandrum]|eukprot:TMW66033.1 hypothetical protein Poli38472_003798 [Pythium oligandrum]
MAEEKRALTKNQRRRLKKKIEKQQAPAPVSNGQNDAVEASNAKATTLPNVEIEYVSMDVQKELDLPTDDPAYEELMRVLGKFSSAEELCGQTTDEDGETAEQKAARKGMEHGDDNGDERPSDDENATEKQLSRKQRKKVKRLSVAELKQLVAYPDVVEAHDVTSADPRFLVYLKSYRNTVPVPRHWSHKRKYLQGKRGIEKQPFLLPDFIAQTGIAEVREVAAEEDDKKKSKQKMRERMKPKMGRVDIDYQVLHDAFFKFQTKPKLSILGDLYYEGKEFEVKFKAKVPGQLSDELKQALGMVEGVPPPWLLNMQRYGPPPAYPNLKIPGLSAPIPEGASFGYHPGGWGKPPVDENGQPLYGDVFTKPVEQQHTDENIKRERWGEMEEVPEEEEDDDEETEEGYDEEYRTEQPGLDATGIETPLVDGIASVSSIASGLTTPGGVVDMRKGIRGTDTPDAPQQLYTVLEQKETSVGTSLYGSGHGYVVPGTASSTGTRSETGRVRRRFEDAGPSDGDVSVASSTVSKDDDEAAKKKKKAKTEKDKKLKDFKF